MQNSDDEYLLAIKLLTSFHFNVPSNVHVEILCLNVFKYVHTRTFFLLVYWFVTPHAQRERGKVIGRGVHIYIYIYITRIMVTIKKRAGVIPYSFSSSIALLSSLLSCSFYLLDPSTISRVDILEMT